uniref:Uncharacterized protein n=1 Tax=Rhizophora mucronata TaxID=61149 RepID=A0A2P2JHV1_RHIMU
MNPSFHEINQNKKKFKKVEGSNQQKTVGISGHHKQWKWKVVLLQSKKLGFKTIEMKDKIGGSLRIEYGTPNSLRRPTRHIQSRARECAHTHRDHPLKYLWCPVLQF